MYALLVLVSYCLLIVARCVLFVFAFVSLDFIPLEPFFRQARQSGKLDVLEIDEGMMLQGLRAAAWRIPFIPTAVGLGTDIVAKSSRKNKISKQSNLDKSISFFS